jgi:copper transport protein
VSRRVPVRLPVLAGLALAWLGLALGGPGLPPSALAHAELRAAEPPDLCLVPKTSRGADLETDAACTDGVVLDQAPSSVRVTFSEQVEPITGGLSVRGPDGRPVTRGDVRVQGSSLAVDVDAAAIGSYVVSWKVVSQDTHPALGSYVFSVGQPSAVADVAAPAELGSVTPLGFGLQVVARLLHFVGFALTFGVLLCSWLALPKGWSLVAPGLVTIGLACLLLAEPVALLGQSASLGTDQLLDPDTLTDILGSSTFGRVLALRVGVALLLWVVLGSARVAPRWLGGVVLALAGALAAIDGQASHAVGAQPPWLAQLANGAHLLAMAIWVGALVLVLTRRLPALGLGRVAGAALAVLVASGIVMGLEHLTAPGDLVQSDYGRALLVKLAVLVGVVILAAVALRAGRTAGWRLRQGEAIGLAAILTAAGLLVSLPPPR